VTSNHKKKKKKKKKIHKNAGYVTKKKKAKTRPHERALPGRRLKHDSSRGREAGTEKEPVIRPVGTNATLGPSRRSEKHKTAGGKTVGETKE